MVANASNQTIAKRRKRTGTLMPPCRHLNFRSPQSFLATVRKPDRAYDLLAQIYGWFSVGFDSPDLRNAMSLLDNLGMNGTERCAPSSPPAKVHG